MCWLPTVFSTLLCSSVFQTFLVEIVKSSRKAEVGPENHSVHNSEKHFFEALWETGPIRKLTSLLKMIKAVELSLSHATKDVFPAGNFYNIPLPSLTKLLSTFLTKSLFSNSGAQINVAFCQVMCDCTRQTRHIFTGQQFHLMISRAVLW